MEKVIPLRKNPIDNLSEIEFSEIEKDLYNFLDENTHKFVGSLPLFQAKKYAIKCIDKKQGLR